MKIFEKEGHKIIWGNALDILTEEIKNRSIDLIFADPPYNIGKSFIDFYFDVFLRDKVTILSRIVWYYDSSGVQAKKYFGSLYEPILYCVKDKNNYTFNSEDILVEAKTGAIRKLIDYRKHIPTVYNSEKVPGNVWEIPRVRY
jgi:site-specific DNA-methyltransferase (adenine-specific)